MASPPCHAAVNARDATDPAAAWARQVPVRRGGSAARTRSTSSSSRANMLFAELSSRRSGHRRALISGIKALAQQISGFVADNKQQLGPTLDKLNLVLDNLEPRREHICRSPQAAALVLHGTGRSRGIWARISAPTSSACHHHRPWARSCWTPTSSPASSPTAWPTSCAASCPTAPLSGRNPHERHRKSILRRRSPRLGLLAALSGTLWQQARRWDGHSIAH